MRRPRWQRDLRLAPDTLAVIRNFAKSPCETHDEEIRWWIWDGANGAERPVSRIILPNVVRNLLNLSEVIAAAMSLFWNKMQ
jgi:hypothetical protein